MSANSADWNSCIERIGRHQDRQAFLELFNHFAPLLKSFVLKTGGMSVEVAEEIVQETMVKIWRKAPSFSASQASASTWIYTIARNTRIDWYRREAVRSSEQLTADDLYDNTEEPAPYASLVRIRNQQRITEQLKVLPQEQEQVLKMMYYEGKTGAQVAAELKLPLGTVKSRIRLALKRLKLNLTTNDDIGAEEQS